jgi:ABC-type nickel/cobalt efflux system permease component RcnA
MVMLFCLSMDVMVLGLVLAGCLALGMATTISIVVIAVTLGKSGLFTLVSDQRAHTIEGILGLVSGGALAAFGVVFLLATVQAAYF